MGTLAKEFETTSQLPPSTTQQCMTPPTVLLPATFAILPLQSTALSASVAAAAAASVTGAGLPVPDRSSSLRAKSNSNGLSIQLPSSCAPPLPSTSPSQSPPQHQVPHLHLVLHRRVSGSPAEANGTRPFTAEDDELMPLTPASATYATRRSVSVFSKSVVTSLDRGGVQSRAHSCSSRSSGTLYQQEQQQRPASAAAAAVLHPTSSSAYVRDGHCEALWQGHSSGSAGGMRADCATSLAAAMPGARTPSSAPSASSTPPAMGTGHIAASQPYALCPGWNGVDGVCAFHPITSFVETTSHEEHSGSRTSTCSSSQQQQQTRSRTQQQQQHRQNEQRTPSSVEGHTTALAAAPGLSTRRSHPSSATIRTHVSLHEGPVVMTTPVSPSIGRQTPSSPLYIAPTMYFHADPARPLTTTAITVGPSGGFGCSGSRRDNASVRGGTTETGDLSAFDNATSRPPTPLSGGNAAAFATAAACTSVGGYGVSVAYYTPGTHVLPSTTHTSYENGGSVGAMDPLSDFSTQSPLCTHSPPPPLQQQQPNTLFKDAAGLHPPYHPSPGSSASANPATSAFPGNLTFLPIEVQSATTVSPFFGSLSSLSASGVSPVSAVQTHHSCATASERARSNSNGGEADPRRMPAMPHLEHPAPSREDVPPSSCGFPPLAATTPTRAHASWSTYAAPGVVTAILAAPEVSWSSFSATVENTAASSTAVTTSGGASTQGHGGRERSTSLTSSGDTAAATSPGSWLQHVHNHNGGGGGSEGTVSGACHHHNGPSLGGWGAHSLGNGNTEEGVAGRGALGHTVGTTSFHSYAAALPTFNGSTVQFQLSCTPVPLEDTESECVICFEGHPSQSGARTPARRDSNGAQDHLAVESRTAEAINLIAETAKAADFGGGVKPGSQLLMMPCKHCCHQNCLQRWLIQSTCCPICRRDLTQDATLSS